MKNILLAVTGLSPQVITETIFALHQNQQQVDEIHVITTRTGKEKIYSQLTGSPKGHFYQYLEEYKIKKNSILFDHSCVHVICDEYGNELEDIATADDNEKLLAKCLGLAFEFTRDQNTSVFFSIAGGRKTMSSCLTLAAQLYGRPCDRLYHVLVSPEFENNRNFFYPPKESRKIKFTDQNGQPCYKETKFATVTLINIPFVSIRPHLSSEQLKEPKDPGTLMLSLVKDESLPLIVNLPDKKISYKNVELDLMPTSMAVYTFFIIQKKNCRKDRKNCRDCTDCFMDIISIMKNAETIAQIYRKICGTRPVEEMSSTGIANLTAENFRSHKSKITRQLETVFGLSGAQKIKICAIGTRPDTKYGILMDKNQIRMVRIANFIT